MKTIITIGLLFSTPAFANSHALNKELQKQLDKEYTRELNTFQIAFDPVKQMYVDFDATVELGKIERKIEAIEKLLHDNF